MGLAESKAWTDVGNMMNNTRRWLGFGLCLALVGIGGCKKRERVEQLEERAEKGQGVTQVETVKENPEAFMGKSIEIAAEVEEMHGPRLVRVDGISTVWGDDILVVMPTSMTPPTLQNGTTVTVKGTVHRLVIAEIERDYDMDLDAEIETEFRDQPVLVASSIEVAAPVTN